MKPVFSIQPGSVKLLKDIGFVLKSAWLRKAENEDICVYFDWTADEDRLVLVKYAEGGRSTSFSNSTITTEVIFPDLQQPITDENHEWPDWMRAATIDVGIEHAPDGYEFSHIVPEKRGLSVFFTKGYIHTRYKDVAKFEIDPYAVRS